LLAIPPVTVALSGSAAAHALWTALRILALEAFTIVFISIVIGAFRPFFNRLTRPRRVQRIHTVTGITGFSLALAHGVCVFIFGIAGYLPGALWVGPTALAVLAVAITTAILRTRLKRSWRAIHRLNYAIFFAVLVHGLILGTDLGASLFLRVVAGVYAAVVLAGFVTRLLRSHRRNTARREPA